MVSKKKRLEKNHLSKDEHRKPEQKAAQFILHRSKHTALSGELTSFYAKTNNRLTFWAVAIPLRRLPLILE